MIRFIKAIILVVAILSLSLLTYDYAKDFYDEYMKEYKGVETVQGKDVVVTIPEGASASEIASILKEAGLIKYKRAFISRLQNTDQYRGKLKSGTYTLNTGMSTLDMMAILSPKVDEITPVTKLVIPEGYTVEMIAQACEDEGVCSEQEFLNAVRSVTSTDFPYLNDVPATANVEYKLQGYLFPATYEIYEDTTAQSLVDWMLETFDNYYTEEIQARAEELGYNSYEVITRASIVEREAMDSEERPMIAGVINNRLRNDMPLQMCPTVLYPLTNGLYDKEQVLYEDLDIESPYNTYKYNGLPVGPICCPGMACIKAVLYPSEHSYFYYHVDDSGNGTHVFSETYEEHEDSRIIGGPKASDEAGDGSEDSEY